MPEMNTFRNTRHWRRGRADAAMPRMHHDEHRSLWFQAAAHCCGQLHRRRRLFPSATTRFRPCHVCPSRYLFIFCSENERTINHAND